jgi:membrane peptidoglycan carboxypeptidase
MRGQHAAIPHAQDERTIDPVSVLKVARHDGSVVYEASLNHVEERIFPEQEAFLVNSVLTDPNAECITFGCGGLSVPGYQVAVKTGTSEPYDPNGPDAKKIGETWAFGYTPDVVVGIWAGNADNAPITNITSTSIAYGAMRDLLLAYYNGRPATPFQPPEGVEQHRVCFVKPARLCTTDWFLDRSFRDVSALAAAPPPPAPTASPPASSSGAPSAPAARPPVITTPQAPIFRPPASPPQNTNRESDDPRERGNNSNRGNSNKNRRN